MEVTQSLVLESTPFVGRDIELAEIEHMLVDPSCRLITLVGPGGIGKTRLACEMLKKQNPIFPDGAYFVPLQPLLTADRIPSTIAEVLAFQVSPHSDLFDQLCKYLYNRSLLLVMDNFEHLLDGSEIISNILASISTVKILVTSRERLNLIEEWVYEVHGLDFPASETFTEIEHYSAIQLFVQNARRVHNSFRLTPAQKPAVSRICRLVDGMPLGIELSAVWVRSLPCQVIAEEIQRSLDILETPARNVSPRHRNMRAVFEPTWNRLTEQERDVFKKLSVFRGGFTHTAAEYVAHATPRLLSGLVDKSLLRLDAKGRFSIHELLRQYGEEQLNPSPQTRDETLNLHRAYFMGFLAECEKEIVFFGRQKEAIEKMNNDLENVRFAWRRAIEQACFEEVSQAAEGLWGFY